MEMELKEDPDLIVFDEGQTEENRAFLCGWQPTSQAAEKDVEESKRVAKRIRAVPKRCWFNARKAVLKLDEYADASLIEGWVFRIGATAIEHGWIVKDGKVIDPTLCEKPIVYFPGLEFRGRKEIKEFDALSIRSQRREWDDLFL